MADVLSELTSVLQDPDSKTGQIPTVAGAVAPIKANDPAPVVDPNSQGALVKQAQAKTQTALTALESVMANTQKQGATLNEESQNVVQERVAQSDVLIAAEAERAARLGANLRPAFKEKEAVAQQRVKVAGMNPIVRAVMGFVDSNYDEEALNQRERALNGVIENAGQEFQYGQMAYGASMDAINQRFTNKQDLLTATRTILNQNVTDAKTNYELAELGMTTAIKGITANREVLQAMRESQGVVLDAIPDTKTAQSYLAQAEKDPNQQVVINGISVTASQLKQRAQQIHAQDVQGQILDLSLQSQQIAVREAAERQYISHLSPTQIQTALQANGRFGNRQLNINYLADAAQSMNTVLDAGRIASMANGAVGAFQQSLQTFGNTAAALGQRVKSLNNGNVPDDWTALVNQRTREIQTMQEKLKNADGPLQDRLAVQYMETIQKWSEERAARIDKMANQVSTNPDVRIGAKAWLSGTQLAPEQAARTFIAITQTGAVIPGFNADGPAGPALKQARAAMDAVYNKYGGKAKFDQLNSQGGQVNPLQPNSPKLSKGELALELEKAVVGAIKQQTVNGRFDDMMGRIPGWAQQDRNPAGKINPKDLAQAQHDGEIEGYNKVAGAMGLSVDQVKAMFESRAQGAARFEAWKAKNPQAPVGTWEQTQRALVAYQTQGMFRSLRASPSATPTFDPAGALVDYFASDNFQSRVQFADAAFPRSDMGAMLSQQILGPNNLAGVTRNMGPRYRSLLAGMDQQNSQIRMENAAAYSGDPVRRSAAIVAAIPGLNPAAEEAVRGYINREVSKHFATRTETPGFVSTLGGAFAGPARATGRPAIEGEGAQFIDNLVLHTKWNDPQLESIRKKIAPQWESMSQSVDRAIARNGEK